ncbi:ABC transporter ATP-binding protein [Dyella japonica]|uniref:ABC transporter ATP-binding protein n=1 Tax=Dyella japonica TaxID=231455 RepID=UPI000570864C|nr:ABC transporter ATP-binding protein [Dyella japonica]
MAHIILDQCGLSLPVYGVGNQSFKQLALSAVTGGKIASTSRHIMVVEALRGVSLDIQPGDRVGLIGHNGSGKTTLLRMLAGIYPPTAGSLSVEGNVTSLIDVTLGMDFESTGYENIYIRGLILGLKKSQIAQLMPEIVEFSGLGEYMHMPVRTYSSGMVLRLAFSIVTSVQPDILLMDEWLSVGDAEFVSRAEARLKRLVDNASILVLASHSPKIVADLCNVRVTLEHGSVVGVERS